MLKSMCTLTMTPVQQGSPYETNRPPILAPERVPITPKASSPLRQEGSDNGALDRTGLLVWPGSRLLGSFLADPLGACHDGVRLDAHHPDLGHLVDDDTRNRGLGLWLEFARGDNTGTDAFGDNGLENGIQTQERAKVDVGAPGRNSRGTSMNERCSTRNEDTAECIYKLPAETAQDAIASVKKTLEENGYTNSLRARHPGATMTVVELGAGTGICGLAAAVALGCPVLLTDGRQDVLQNLRQNVKLNGLEDRVSVAPLAWGATGDRVLSLQVQEHAPFKLILASDTVYPGKPGSDTEDFFYLVKDLLDAEEGVLLFAYTPRPPSMVTETMLRCAYRVGLRGTRLGYPHHGKAWPKEGCTTKTATEGNNNSNVNDSIRGASTRENGTRPSQSEDNGDAKDHVSMASSSDDRVVLIGGHGNCVGRKGLRVRHNNAPVTEPEGCMDIHTTIRVDINNANANTDKNTNENADENTNEHLSGCPNGRPNGYPDGYPNGYVKGDADRNTDGNAGDGTRTIRATGRGHDQRGMIRSPPGDKPYTPVLLAFRMAKSLFYKAKSSFWERGASGSTMDNNRCNTRRENNGERDTNSKLDQEVEEMLFRQWKSEWRQMFPGIHFKNAPHTVMPFGRLSDGHRQAHMVQDDVLLGGIGRKGELGAAVDDCTEEDLWGEYDGM